MKKKKELAVFAAAAAVLYAVFYLTGIGCPIKFITGISCAGCGMTRAWAALAALDVKSALYYHPLVFVPPVYCAVFAFRKKIGERRFKIATGFFVFLFLAVYLTRLLDTRDSIVVFDIKDSFIIKFFNTLGGILHD